MPAALINYTRQPYTNSAAALLKEASAESESAESEQLVNILEQLRLRSHYDFSSYRKHMMLRRIQRRMGLHQLEHLEQYVAYLKQNPQEVISLYRDLLISVTAFFRDTDAYQALSTRFLLEFSSRNEDQFPYRVWVPGCATGEEAYSVAMLLLEGIATVNDTKKQAIQVFASDVDAAAIAVARVGVYPASIAGDVSQARLKRFFVKADDGRYQIGKQLRESIVFSRQNLINDAPFSKLDLISCRNVLIYFEPEMQHKIIGLFHFALADHGMLMLGPSESVARAGDLFEPISKKWRIFQKAATHQRRAISIPITATAGPQRPNSMSAIFRARKSQNLSPPKTKQIRNDRRQTNCH